MGEIHGAFVPETNRLIIVTTKVIIHIPVGQLKLNLSSSINPLGLSFSIERQ